MKARDVPVDPWKVVADAYRATATMEDFTADAIEAAVNGVPDPTGYIAEAVAWFRDSAVWLRRCEQACRAGITEPPQHAAGLRLVTITGTPVICQRRSTNGARDRDRLGPPRAERRLTVVQS
jgi:hypothetical protein